MKHRIWDKEQDCWWFGNTAIDADGDIMLGRDCREWAPVADPEQFIIEYCTGLEDKNEVDIYGGDIVTVKMSFEGGFLPHVGEVVYVETFGAFATKNEAGETLFHNHLLDSFEVIGNIHQHPELLEK